MKKKEAENIEVFTRGQAKSKPWFLFREGRLTASKFKAACLTDSACPSQSLKNQFVIQKGTSLMQRLHNEDKTMKVQLEMPTSLRNNLLRPSNSYCINLLGSHPPDGYTCNAMFCY